MDSFHRIPAVAGVAAKSVAFVGVGQVARGSVPAETLRRAAGAATRQLAGASRVGSRAAGRRRGGARRRRRGRAARRLRLHPVPQPERQLGAEAPVASVTVVSPAAAGAGARAAAKRARVWPPPCTRRATWSTPRRSTSTRRPSPRRPRGAVADLPVEVTVLDERRLTPRRLRRHPRRRPGLVAAAAAGPAGLRAGRRRPRTWRSSARASRSTPAGCRSSRPPGMDAMKSDMSGAAAVLHAVVAAAPARAAAAGHRLAGARGEHAVRDRAAPVGRADRARRPHGRGAQHRRRGPAGAGGRARRRRRAGPGRDRRHRDADRRADGGARQPDVRDHVERRRRCATGCTGVADRVGEQFWPMPLPPELRASMDSRVADIANIGDRYGGMLVAGLFLKEFVPTARRRAPTPRPCRGPTSTSPARRSTPEPPTTTRRPAVPEWVSAP